MFAVIPLPPLDRLFGATANLLSLLQDGTLADAFVSSDPHATHCSVVAFDVLEYHRNALLAERNTVSPFLRYRREILGQYPTAVHLRCLVMNLFIGSAANLNLLFSGADALHTRIALECIASVAGHHMNDRHFMDLAAEILAMNAVEEVVA